MALEHFKKQVLLLHNKQATLDDLSRSRSDRYTVHCAASGSEALNYLGETEIGSGQDEFGRQAGVKAAGADQDDVRTISEARNGGPQRGNADRLLSRSGRIAERQNVKIGYAIVHQGCDVFASQKLAPARPTLEAEALGEFTPGLASIDDECRQPCPGKALGKALGHLGGVAVIEPHEANDPRPTNQMRRTELEELQRVPEPVSVGRLEAFAAHG